jgi:hypothetical protein
VSITGTRYAFNAYEIAHAPVEQGVLALWDGDELIYVGRTVGRYATIRSVLLDHWAGFLGPCTKAASHFSWEKSNLPALREAEVLEQFARQHNRLPRCRDKR